MEKVTRDIVHNLILGTGVVLLTPIVTPFLSGISFLQMAPLFGVTLAQAIGAGTSAFIVNMVLTKADFLK